MLGGTCDAEVFGASFRALAHVFLRQKVMSEFRGLFLKNSPLIRNVIIPGWRFNMMCALASRSTQAAFLLKSEYGGESASSPFVGLEKEDCRNFIKLNFNEAF